MDDYKEETKAVDEALVKMIEEKSAEAIDEFRDKLKTLGEKFDSARKTEVATCFCGEPIDDPTEQEISPSMYYFNSRTCSDRCHNQWILGQFEGTSRPVGKGWWSIIDELDRNISELDPDYTITQIKEKFGTLRFYADFTEPERPLGITNEEVWAVESVKSNLFYEIDKAKNPDEWYSEEDRPEEVPEWKKKNMEKNYANLSSLVARLRPIQTLIDEAESLSAKTCEWCGEPGSLDNSNYWLLTLCDGCKQKRADGGRG